MPQPVSTEPTPETPRAHFVFHGHFYQPPRENPWTDEVEREPSARPYHDWNERIDAECYAANAAARIHDDQGRILRIVNNYALVSFNFGPTLLKWMERHDPLTLRRLIEADQRSVERHDGHGNAIAQVYNHVIMALADSHDRRTQIRWGLAEFEARFGRRSESVWLAETAANHEVLEQVIEEGLAYVILAPLQAGWVRAEADGDWQDVRGGRVDPSRPYRYVHRDGSGREVAVFFYDGPLAQSVSFGGALDDGKNLAYRAGHAVDPGRRHEQLIHLAVDGETAGHHVGFGNLALAWALQKEIPAQDFEVTNYGAYLAKNPATWEIRLDEGPFGEGTSWSCAHGVGRWIRDCSCRIDPGSPSQQIWRGPLRRALDLIRDRGRRFFLEEAEGLLHDPWAARDDYVDVLLDGSSECRTDFLEKHSTRPLEDHEWRRAFGLLEMQHQCQLMYTSCGWFFDDVGGLETVQILRYAARALEIWEELGGESCRADFEAELAKARSNDPSRGTGADILRRDALAVRVTPERIVAHLAMGALLAPPPETGRLALHDFERVAFHLRERDDVRLVTGHFVLEHARTARRVDLQVAMLHTGGLDFVTMVGPYAPESFEALQSELHTTFEEKGAADVRDAVATIPGARRFGAADLLESGRQDLLSVVFQEMLDRFSQVYSDLYDENRDLLRSLHELGMDLPEELKAATTFTLRKQFEREFLEHADATDPKAHARAIKVVRDALARDVRLDSRVARQHMQRMLVERVSALGVTATSGDVDHLEPVIHQIEDLLSSAHAMSLELEVGAAQIAFHDALMDPRVESSLRPDVRDRLDRLGERLGFAPGVLEAHGTITETATERAEATRLEDAPTGRGRETRK